MTVFKSNKLPVRPGHRRRCGRYARFGRVLEESLKGFKRNVDGAAKLGEEIGKRLKEKSVAAVVFDRNGYKYHGIVKAIADGARKAGITF